MEDAKEPHPGGRPLTFTTNKELELKIYDYFDSCREGKNPTITGLAYFLGFESRQSFYDYEGRGEFSYTIKRARLLIESNYEQALRGRNPAGPIFALKNFGWTDRQEVISRNVNYNTELTQEDIKKISQSLEEDV